MPEHYSTGSGVVERGHLEKRLKVQRMTIVSFGSVIGAKLFIGGWQFCPHWRRVMGDFVRKRSATFSPVSSNLLRVWHS
jgi:hypothetical protein